MSADTCAPSSAAALDSSAASALLPRLLGEIAGRGMVDDALAAPIATALSRGGARPPPRLRSSNLRLNSSSVDSTDGKIVIRRMADDAPCAEMGDGNGRDKDRYAGIVVVASTAAALPPPPSPCAVGGGGSEGGREDAR